MDQTLANVVSVDASNQNLPYIEKSEAPVESDWQSSGSLESQSIARQTSFLGSTSFEESYEDLDDSPYPEVRSAVANFDDPTMPVSTLRSWTIGIAWTILSAGINSFLYFRYPSVSVGALVVQLVSFPTGRAWEKIFPDVTLFGIPVNPGPFTIKEHVLVTLMAGVSAQCAYAIDIVAVQRFYYNQPFNFLYQWLLVISTQLIGFSIGGVVRRFLVTPPSMIWPNILVSCALFNTIHSQRYAGAGPDGGISRERFCAYAMISAIAWYFFPGYLFQGLSFFSWVCWIRPNDVIVNQLFGYQSGLGMSLFTFDWNQISYIGSPLSMPFWAQMNVMLGFFLFYWILTPALYYSNVWNAQYLPIASATAFDNTGNPYNVSRILDSHSRMNTTAYNEYSPLFISTSFALSYGLSFLAISATVTHSIIYFWEPLKLRLRFSESEAPDIHARLMSHYSQVPGWWYCCLFGVMFTFACICVEVWPTGLPIWALVVALALATLFAVPIGMIQAITNIQVGLNVMSEFMIGYMLPGRPIAMMIFKTFTYITMIQAMQYTADFKLGHYMKIPPKTIFCCQVVGTVIAGTVQLCVETWMFSNITDMCHPDQKDSFTCRGTYLFYTSSIIWGVIGPRLLFSKAHMYSTLTFLFLVGAACPLISWLIQRRYRLTILRYLNFPVIFQGSSPIPQATGLNFVPWAIVGFIFQYLLRRRRFIFWAKYNYVLSAALDSGTAIGVVLVYFCLQYPLQGTIGQNTIQKWWGNTVFTNTMDWKGVTLRQLQPGETLG